MSELNIKNILISLVVVVKKTSKSSAAPELRGLNKGFLDSAALAEFRHNLIKRHGSARSQTRTRPRVKMPSGLEAGLDQSGALQHPDSFSSQWVASLRRRTGGTRGQTVF